jgi:polo-like kinase 4
MLYTMLVGRPPFDTRGIKNTLDRIIAGDYYLPDDLSPEAQHLIHSLLQKNPADRLHLKGRLFVLH